MIFFANGAAFASWLTRIPALRERLHMGERQLGVVLLATALGALLAFRAAGKLIGTYGSKAVTRAAALCFIFLLSMPSRAPSALGAAVALGWLGVANGLLDVAMNSQAVDLERRLGRPILSAFHGALSLGSLVGAALGTAAATFDVPAALHLSCISMVMVLPLRLAGRALSAATHGHDAANSYAPATRPNKTLLALGSIAFCSSVGEGAMADWAAIYLRSVLHTSMGIAAMGYAFFAAAMVVGRFCGDRLTSLFGASQVVRAGGLQVASELTLGLTFNTVASMNLAFACVGLGRSTVVPVVFRLGSNMPGVPRGHALATMATLSYGGFLLGPPIIGCVAEHVTLRGGLGLVIGLALVKRLQKTRHGTTSGRQPSGRTRGSMCVRREYCAALTSNPRSTDVCARKVRVQ